ncbi:DUF2509 family protein [Klebsiella quasipneumoniae]|uniref:DUF2509 family protein n=1 Tax=Klebsiella quasipneumoniae TaxID=1463165 RepID=UPI00388F43AF
MIRQRGMSSLLMVLLLLTLGSLLLEGLNLQQRALLANRQRNAGDPRYGGGPFGATVGKQQAWSAQAPLACREQAQQGWRACLRIFDDGSLLLSSASGEVQVWQSGEVRGGQVHFSAHGWSDFCPLREVSLCQMP